ncbi:site-specific tyrosine recombinase XerC [Aliikangiella maris]|uniref:Site-specific tyrosine recombinase XerC n=2 Tax=Aliikangiella maris TaxID=3162458 RepID=A0ABV2BXW3_9GAMM
MVLRTKHHNQSTRQQIPIEHNGIYPYLVRYLDWLLVKGYSVETKKSRDNALRTFIEWCDQRDIQQPQDVTKPILERYQRHLFYYRKDNGKPIAFSTQKSLLQSVKGFFKWLTQQNYLLYNPASEIQMPKAPKRLPKTILSVEQIKSIIHQPDTSTPQGIRDRAILELLYSTGIRRMELCNLKIHELNLERKTVLILGKGSKERMLPIGQSAITWLVKYLDDVRPQLCLALEETSFFLTDYGEAYTGSVLGWLVKNTMKNAGIHIEGSCHLFRHAMATHMLENGSDIRFIQAMLGHSELSTTEIYTKVSVEKLREIHSVTHPAEKSDRNINNDKSLGA